MNFDKYQQAAINYNGSAIVVATAGSGKTTTLIEKVRKVSETVPPQNIVCLSFTKEAVKQLSERMVGVDKRLKNIQMRTIHSFSRNIICNNNPDVVVLKSGYDGVNRETGRFEKGDVQLLADNILPHYLNRVCKESLDMAEQVMRYIKLRICRMEGHTEYFEDFEEIFEKSALCKMHDEYLALLRKHNYITQDTMCLEALELLQRNEKLRNRVQDACKYLFIDEAQDLSRDQYELIKLVTAKGKIFMVGDGEQAIYGFRGGMSELFLNAHKDFEDVEVLHLPINYRSSYKIVNLGNAIARTSDEADDINYMDAIANNQGECDTPEALFGNSVVNMVAKKILEEYSLTNDYSEIAVLGRTNKSLMKLKATLYKHKIPCRLNDRNGLPPEIKLLCNYLKLIVNHNDDKAFIEIYNKPVRYIGKSTLQNIEKISAKRKISLFEAMPYAAFTSRRIRQNAIDFYEDIDYISTHKYRNAGCAIKDLLKKIDFAKAMEKMYSGDKAAQDDAMSNLLDFVSDASSYKTLGEYANDILTCMGENDADGVVLSTVHKAKGLEWDSVIITDFNNGMFPHKKSNDVNEETHVFYVAVTRARKRLCFVGNSGDSTSPYFDIISNLTKAR